MNLLESIIQKGDLAQLKKLAHENPQLIRGASENGLPLSLIHILEVVGNDYFYQLLGTPYM